MAQIETCNQDQSNNSINQKETLPKKQIREEDKKEILFSGGGGGLAFMAGYAHGMIEIVGKEKLREYEVGCISAGAILGLVFHYVVRQEKYDIRYFYNEWFRKCYEKGNKKYGGFFTSGSLLRDCSKLLIKMIEENGVEHLNDKVHLQISVIEKLIIPKRKMVSTFNDGEDLGEALQSTCGIPFLLNFSFFSSYRGQKTLDGGFTGIIPYKYENSKKKIFVNVLPKQSTYFPFVWKKPKNCEMLHITENSQVRFPKDFWLWDEYWADDMFMRGILAAKMDAEKLTEMFKE